MTPEPVRRTREIEDPTNLFFVHAIANRLTPRLAQLHVHPNAVSVAGMGFGVAAGLAYAIAGTAPAIAGFALMIAWHVMDGTDGQLARLTGKQSETGKVLDGICDYVTFAAVYVALALRISRDHGAIAWPLVILAGACHAFQAAAYEQQRQDYDAWAWGRRKGPTAPAKAGGLHRLYVAMQSIAAGSGEDRRRLDQLLARGPDIAILRRRFRETFASPVRNWCVLSANYRTIGIFLCVLTGLPLLYFIIEITALTGLLALLSMRQRRRVGSFVRAVQGPGPWRGAGQSPAAP